MTNTGAVQITQLTIQPKRKLQQKRPTLKNQNGGPRNPGFLGIWRRGAVQSVQPVVHGRDRTASLMSVSGQRPTCQSWMAAVVRLNRSSQFNLVQLFRCSNHIGILAGPHPRATARPLPREEHRGGDASRRMAATHGLAATLRDAHIGSAKAPARRAPQDEVVDRFTKPSVRCSSEMAGRAPISGWARPRRRSRP
jgi:hypothetical protein